MSYPTDPKLECDIVMKGGITSGVIYPMAVCNLAKTYRLRSVGGASAGAIAAAAAAAAEFGRPDGGFTRLEELPNDITKESRGKSTLFGLFQPTKASYPLFRAFTAGMGKSQKALWTVLGLLIGFWPWAVVGAVPGIAVVILCANGTGWARGAGVAAGVVLAVLGLAVAVVLGVLKVLNGVPKAGFGLCTGMPGAGSKGAEALTPWLHTKLQTIAGRMGKDPLTFGELETAGIQLKTMTSNLTLHQPMAMPWTAQTFFFDPKVMRTLFPEDVVKWMEDHPPTNGLDGSPLAGAQLWDRDLLWLQARSQQPPMFPFPAPADVPILVAARMSLSFPLLISAVPLYAVDYNLVANRRAGDAADQWRRDNPGGTVEAAAAALGDVRPAFDPNWFSDGGICSNLPVHFFDAPLPTRPTFAVDLASFPDGWVKDPKDQSKNVYLPERNGGRLRPSAPIPTKGITSLGAFLFEIVDTARGWVDAAQLVLPGYRDRVVTIYHDDQEGGMNLTMPKQTLDDLSARGGAAAAKLVSTFAGDDPGETPTWGWDNSRWIRFRTASAGLKVWLDGFSAGYGADAPGATPYKDLAGPNAEGALPSNKVAGGARDSVNSETGELLTLATSWQDGAMLKAAPKPRPRLRLVPDDGTAAGLANAAQSTDTPGEEPDSVLA
jgi:predicted acylesterase/phospholipase RssA